MFDVIRVSFNHFTNASFLLLLLKTQIVFSSKTRPQTKTKRPNAAMRTLSLTQKVLMQGERAAASLEQKSYTALPC